MQRKTTPLDLLARAALFAALIFLGTYALRIPIPSGYIHFGDGFLYGFLNRLGLNFRSRFLETLWFLCRLCFLFIGQVDVHFRGVFLSLSPEAAGEFVEDGFITEF